MLMMCNRSSSFRSWLSGVCVCLLLSTGCEAPRSMEAPAVGAKLFTTIPAEYSGVAFRNDLSYTEAFNPYTFRNFYNGGGVGLGDFNRDGLLDVYLCGNQVDNRLYLNRGAFRFEDITDQAGVACPGVWSSGVSVVDINGDGWLDIYVCKSGSPEGRNRHNELFINQGDPDEEGVVTFREQAKAWGIDDLGLSTHAAFFDYDRDGDLDCYLLNNSLRSVGGYDLIKDQRETPDSLGGNKLYRHEGDHFTDVSQQAGIYSSAIGFGLGVTIGDLDRDGWLDIYVSNDFFERDYLYLNQQDGTFEEVLPEQMPEISLSSMGADMADLNHDGYPEVFVTDMLPEGDRRMKTKTQFENWDKYQLNLRQGYHRQFTRNVLQLNRGNHSFSEIGRMASVFATDWSWGALMFDFDNDGYRDIFVANGIYKDLTDQDYINFFASPQAVRRMIRQDENVIETLIDSIPSEAVSNYAFVQQPQTGAGYLPRFTNQAEALGLAQPGFSNGSAYGDLDNDGDLDLVINNVNAPASLYRNESDTLRAGHHWLGLILEGQGKNSHALGSRVTIKAAGKTFYQELAPMRGFESCVDSRLLMGLGTLDQVDTLLLQWPDGSYCLQTEVAVDQYLTVRQQACASANLPSDPEPAATLWQSVAAPDWSHHESEYQDFRRERLLFHMRSNEGPAMCQGDFNGDGLADLFVGGAKYQPGQLFFQQANGQFTRQAAPALAADSVSEDTDCACFDADGDGDLDLYVASGGNELPLSSISIRDRLYRNDGRGRFRSDPEAIRAVGYRSTGAVATGDFDQDGDEDLFVGTRLRPNLTGVPVDGVLLRNDGRGTFEDMTEALAPELKEIGMITDAAWGDLDQDGDLDLVVVGEWMPVAIFHNENGQLMRQPGPEQSNGWWHSLALADVNGDQRLDLILGNWGLNSRFQASPDRSARMYVNDFDGNGNAEQIITVYQGDQAYPLALRPDLVAQMPVMKRKYLKHARYAEQTIEDMFTSDQMDGALVMEVYRAESGVYLNQAEGGYAWQPFPALAQVSPLFALAPGDFDGDGHLDLLAGGNFLRAKPEVGSYAASYGLHLRGRGDGTFARVEPSRSGFDVKGEIREIAAIPTAQGWQVIVARNDQPLAIFSQAELTQ